MRSPRPLVYSWYWVANSAFLASIIFLASSSEILPVFTAASICLNVSTNARLYKVSSGERSRYGRKVSKFCSNDGRLGRDPIPAFAALVVLGVVALVLFLVSFA